MAALEFAFLFFFINVLPAAGFVFYFTREKTYLGLADKLILSVILSPLVLVLLSFLEESVGAPQSPPVLTANVIALAVINIFILARRFPGRENYALNMGWENVFIYALFIALVQFRVLPVNDILAPITHDPIAHGVWLKHLNANHFTSPEHWYPQGLEYYFNYYATFFDFTYARIMLIGTNFLLALFPVSFFYLGYLSLKGTNRRLVTSLTMFVFASAVAMPNELPLTAGKNSMIFAFASIPLLLYMISWMEKRWEYMATMLFVCSIIIVHYPTGLFLLFIFFFYNLYEVLGFSNRKPSIDRNLLAKYIPVLPVLAGFAALLLNKTLSVYLNNPPGNDNTINGLIELKDKIGVLRYVTELFFKDIRHIYGLFFLLMLLLSIAVIIIIRGEQKLIPVKITASSVALYLIGCALLFLGSDSHGIFYFFEMGFFLVFMLVVCLSWVFYYLLERTIYRLRWPTPVSIFIAAVLGIVFVLSGFSDFDKYSTVYAGAETVRAEDIEAFNFMDSHIQNDREILIQLGYDDQLRIVVVADSGAWIPAFTDKEVQVPWLENSNPVSFEIYELYLAVAKDGDDRDAIYRLYCDYDIGYLFFGSRKVYSDNMNQDVIAGSRYFEKLFGNGAAIYRIRPEACPVA